MSPEKRKRTESHKKKTQPTKRVQGGFPWALLLLCLLIPVAFGLGMMLVMGNLALFDFYTADAITATMRSIRQTEVALASEMVANEQAAFANAETHIALERWQGDLHRDATQVALNDSATQTAIAIANVQQATRVAFDFSATQTQVGLDYAGTQSALNQKATAIALGITPGGALPNVFFTATPAPLSIRNALFEDEFTEGLSGGLWQYAIDDWIVSDGVLTATGGGALLLTQTDRLTDYVLEVDLATLATGGTYFALLNLPQDKTQPGLALRLIHNGARLIEAGLVQFSQEALITEGGLGLSSLTTIATMQVDSTLSYALNIQVTMRDEQVIVVVNDQQVLEVVLSESLIPGAIGLQVPFSTGIERIAVYP